MINSDELLFVVDENNNPTEPKSRSYTHANGLWHRTSHIFVINDKGNVLCQQRSLKKDQSPGKWEPFFGGHLGTGKDYIEGAITELSEELGINIPHKEIKQYVIYKYEHSKEFCGVFYVVWNGAERDLNIEKEEVEKVVWIPIEDVLKHYEPISDPNWTHIGYEPDLLKFINNQNDKSSGL